MNTAFHGGRWPNGPSVRPPCATYQASAPPPPTNPATRPSELPMV